MEEFRNQTRELVKYMVIDDDDPDVIENYTDTLLHLCEEYHQLKLKNIAQ